MELDLKASLKAVLQAEAAAISQTTPSDKWVEAISLIEACPGKIITLGIGKAGLIAQKFAATLCSGCTPALFLHPAEAAHGDLGVVSEKDLIVAFSTSGKSREVLETLQLCQHLGVKSIIGITSHQESPLRDLATLVIDMGTIEEPCPLKLTPSASVAVMLAISDALALTLMRKKGITKKEYGLRHHGGYLGRKARTDND